MGLSTKIARERRDNPVRGLEVMSSEDNHGCVAAGLLSPAKEHPAGHLHQSERLTRARIMPIMKEPAMTHYVNTIPREMSSGTFVASGETHRFGGAL